MHRRDVVALNKSLAAFKKLSPRARAEISELQLRCGWRAAAIHASMRCQRIALGLPDSSLTPFEPHPPRAIEAEEARREALGVATEPAGDAA
jgi:hypothetical protein